MPKKETIAIDSKTLYCTMLHIACFLDDSRKGRIANFAAPCAMCRLRQIDPTRESLPCRDGLSHLNTLAAQVGVRISALATPEDYPVHLEE